MEKRAEGRIGGVCVLSDQFNICDLNRTIFLVEYSATLLLATQRRDTGGVGVSLSEVRLI